MRTTWGFRLDIPLSSSTFTGQRRQCIEIEFYARRDLECFAAVRRNEIMIDNLKALADKARADWKHAWELRAALQRLIEHMTVSDLVRLADQIADERNGN
jgi:hypothetical protein